MRKITDEDIENYPSIAPTLNEFRRRRNERIRITILCVLILIAMIMILIFRINVYLHGY